jgi:hypothetical protein
VTHRAFASRLHAPAVRLRTACTLALIVGVVLGAFPGRSLANYLWDYTADAVNIRQGPWTSYTSNGLGYPGQGACEFSEVSGETVNGNPYWLYHENLTTFVQGYSTEAYLSISYPNTCTP